MLFPYIYVPHQMEKMQDFIDFIFYEVWCKAPIGLVFHPDLFNGNPELKDVMVEFGFSVQAAERGKAFYKDVKSIYDLFASLSPREIEQFKQWYQGNNDLEKVCANDPAAHLARYADIAVNHNKLATQLGAFFKGLYSQSLLDLAALSAKIGDIDEHYHAFVQTNKIGKCPFCGINDLLGEYHNKREAYDHYLPKALYPFNSINFRNLVPACHHCNSSYKTSKDPAYTLKDPAGAANRRAVFYPYKAAPHSIELQVDLQHSDIARLTPAHITLQFGPAAIAQEIDTWRDVYGIEERYKSKLCTEGDGKAWLTQVLDEWKELGRDPQDFLKTLAFNTEKRPFTDCNFLKEPFLDACRRKGIFN
ncbi:HNH endonuclease [Tahibacter sp. UC22_41]|uniref:HNH endonuclease n=1 Tax=Tahibacter sp. UC22_41 TaxID=3350178 RepID=UPI0036DC0563